MVTAENLVDPHGVESWARERGVELGTPGIQTKTHGPGADHYCPDCFTAGMRYQVDVILEITDLELEDLNIDDINFVEAP